MDAVKHFFTGRRVTVLGLGLLGRGVGDAAFIASCGAEVTVTDLKSADELHTPMRQLAGYNITFHLGGHVSTDFTDTDMVIKAAGVRLDSKEIAAARAAKIPVYMSTALAAQFAREMGVKIVGVTGTRGKSTVAHMIHYALDAAGKRTHLGGNVRGVSTLALLPEMRAGDILVLELDSWQLQGFGDLAMSPDIAVFTNLQRDHQNYYADMESYFADKANIFKYQKEGDALIATPELADRIRGVGARGDAYRKDVHAPIPADWQFSMPGEHNRVNAALAAAALEVVGLSEKDIRAGLASFAGVEGRLERLREIDGVTFYNDNNATTPEATIAALTALDQGKQNIILILGGADKGLETDALLKAIHATCKRVVLLKGTGSDRIAEELREFQYEDLEAALQAAIQGSAPGDIVLFSPGFASFGMFKNEYDRNDRFLGIVKKL